MNTNALTYMEIFFMALADKTRLRLLNLMRDQEVCVCFFTEVFGESQPKVSRHLAYLRNSGLVDTRRDGTWIHYSIAWPADHKQKIVLEETLDWLAGKKEMRDDRSRYEEICRSPNGLIQIARSAAASFEPAADRSDEPVALHQAHNELEEFLL